jgi:hypothetical protein
MMNWIRYSGISIVFHLNPLHWKVLPWFRREINEWATESERTYSFTFLFLTIRIWIDNGEW